MFELVYTLNSGTRRTLSVVLRVLLGRCVLLPSGAAALDSFDSADLLEKPYFRPWKTDYG